MSSPSLLAIALDRNLCPAWDSGIWDDTSTSSSAAISKCPTDRKRCGPRFVFDTIKTQTPADQLEDRLTYITRLFDNRDLFIRRATNYMKHGKRRADYIQKYSFEVYCVLGKHAEIQAVVNVNAEMVESMTNDELHGKLDSVVARNKDLRRRLAVSESEVQRLRLKVNAAIASKRTLQTSLGECKKELADRKVEIEDLKRRRLFNRSTTTVRANDWSDVSSPTLLMVAEIVTHFCNFCSRKQEDVRSNSVVPLERQLDDTGVTIGRLTATLGNGGLKVALNHHASTLGNGVQRVGATHHNSLARLTGDLGPEVISCTKLMIILGNYIRHRPTAATADFIARAMGDLIGATGMDTFVRFWESLVSKHRAHCGEGTYNMWITQWASYGLSTMDMGVLVYHAFGLTVPLTHAWATNPPSVMDPRRVCLYISQLFAVERQDRVIAPRV